MKVDIAKGENSTCTVNVAVDPSEVQAARETAVAAAIKFVSVPGFRKGKAPRRMAEQNLDQTALQQKIMENLIRETLPKAIEDSKINAVSRPEVDIESFDPETGFLYKAVVEVYPEVNLEKDMYVGLKLNVKKDNFEEPAVKKAVEFLQEQVALYEPIEEDRGLVIGDHALVDFECIHEGKKVDEGSVKDYSMQLEESAFVPGFVANIIGVKKGGEKEFEIQFPEDYHSVLKGKHVTFKFKLHEIRKKTLPELNDEFAKSVSECDTYEEMLADIREKMAKNAAERTMTFAKNAAADMFAEQIKIDLPQTLVSQEIANMLNQMAESYARQGVDIFKGVSEDDIKVIADSRKEEAKRRVTVNAVLSAIAKNENLEVSDQEVDQKIKDLTEVLGQDFRKAKNNLIKNGRIHSIKDSILLDKALQFAVDNAEITYIEADEHEASEENHVHEADIPESEPVDEVMPEIDGEENK